MLYFDNNATTKVHPDVIKEMMPFMEDHFGNPDSKYYEVAEQAKSAVNKSREKIAKILNCQNDEIVFTSGATESNNMIIKGVALQKMKFGKHLITTAIEHSSVYETFKYLESIGFEVTYLPVDKKGQIDYSKLESAIRSDTILISIMWVNNEIGSINDIKHISELCRLKKVDFHTDATQAIGKLDIDLSYFLGITYMSFSGHKIYGPKGIGIAFIRKDDDGLPRKIVKLLHGGEQENNYRAGTLNVPSIVGIAKALEIVSESIDDNRKNAIRNEMRAKNFLISLFGSRLVFNNDFEHIPGVISFRVTGINNQILIKELSKYLALSTGSACSNMKPSRVLKEIGLNSRDVSESIRLSIPSYYDESDFDATISELIE